MLVTLPAIGLTVRNLLAPVDVVVGRVPDDALYYLVLARRLAAGEGFTFDGLAPTTGFHPAWLAIVAAVVPTGEPEAGLRGLLALHGLVTVGCVLVLDHVTRQAGARSWTGALSAAAAGAWGASVYGLGMETSLVALLSLAAVAVGMRAGGGNLVAGLLGVAMGLARVDALPMLLGAGRRAPAALVGGIVGVLLTAGFNLAVAGEGVSTAARIKSLGTVAERLARLDPAVMWRHVPGAAVAAVVVIGVAYARRRSDTSGVSACVTPPAVLLGAGGGLVWLAAAYLGNNLVGPWYHLPVTWVLVAGAGIAAARTRGALGGVLAVGLAVALLRGVALPAPGLHATVVAFARAVAVATDPDARVIAEDFPGAVAWFGERTVLPADGLAASPGYREALTTGAAVEWWRARGATHYAVTRRRAGWLATGRVEGRLVDHIAPPFLPVPPSPVPLEVDQLLVERVDAGSGRLFGLFEVGE